MYTIFDKIPTTVILFALAILQAAFIYLFISLVKSKRKRLSRIHAIKNRHGGEVYGPDPETSERMYQKTLDKINRSNPQKIIVSTLLYSEKYFFTEN